ncbi:ATP-binding protein [Tabrizicola sp.]|uniref:hybrid sensor histidine kinase/response regulator n=1 Tax=Tabrizicola sp. TaxID=2005166 RepID=UPI00286B3F07|nr:ATP-binding protein [Tabrizicola sp.]
MTSAEGMFLARNSPDGLFLRYAGGRSRGFLLRQSMTLLGGLAIGLLHEPWLGALCVVLALAGDGMEHLVLRRIVAQGAVRRRRLAAFMALIQALTIAACVIITWQWIPLAAAEGFALAFLMSATINAGLVMPHFPEGTWLRLGVYGTTFLAMAVDKVAHIAVFANTEQAFGLLAGLILVYATVLFIRSSIRGHAERLRFESALLEEKRALEVSQAALAETARRTERLALVAQKANDNVLFTAADGRIEWVNEAFTTSTGYSFDEAVGRFPGDILNGPETSAEALAELHGAQAAGVPCRVEIQNRSKSGQLIWMEVSMTPVLKPDGSPDVWIAIERDITHAKAQAAELAEARQVAEAANRAKSQFLATMSHEIRTPMNGVIGVAELLQETALTPAQTDYVGTIIDSGRALLDIINDVLDLSKLQSGKVEIAVERFSVAEIVRRCMDILQPTVAKKGIMLTCDVPANLGMHLGDPGRLRQIMLNLIGNAVKFTEHGRVRVTVTAEAQGDAPDSVRIAVADTGIGIAPDRIGQVFESFTQADNSISRKFGGTGLGLTISRMLAQQIGGDIDVVSTFGAGSVFTLALPMARAKAGQAAASSTLIAPRTKLRLIVADDNSTNRLIARKLLERSVASIVEAATGAEALALYQRDPPDLVLMDVSMPEMDGREATRWIRAHEAAQGLPPCPIHALTAFVSTEERDDCLAVGMNGVLTKPLIRADLYALLAAVAGSGFDLSPRDDIDRAANGEPSWSISPPASGTTNGRLTRLSGR